MISLMTCVMAVRRSVVCQSIEGINLLRQMLPIHGLMADASSKMMMKMIYSVDILFSSHHIGGMWSKSDPGYLSIPLEFSGKPNPKFIGDEYEQWDSEVV